MFLFPSSLPKLICVLLVFKEIKSFLNLSLWLFLYRREIQFILPSYSLILWVFFVGSCHFFNYWVLILEKRWVWEKSSCSFLVLEIWFLFLKRLNRMQSRTNLWEFFKIQIELFMNCSSWISCSALLCGILIYREVNCVNYVKSFTISDYGAVCLCFSSMWFKLKDMDKN